MNFFKIKFKSTIDKKSSNSQPSVFNKKWIILIFALPLIIFLIFKKENANITSTQKEKTSLSEAPFNPDLWNKKGPFSGFSPKAELVSYRDKNAKHFSNEDGTMTALISNGAVHYEAEDGAWQEINPRLQKSSRNGFSYENTTNGIKSWYPNGNGKKAVLMEVKGQQLSLAEKMELSWVDRTGKILLSQSAKYRDPEVKGNILVYPSFFPGIKNEFEVGFDQIKNKVILDEKPDARGDYLILKEQLNLPEGWQVQVQDKPLIGEKMIEGGFELVDEEGSIQLYIPAPEVFDQNENSKFQNKVPARWILEQKGLQLDLKMQVNQSWLQDPGREYPVILDPTVYLTANLAGIVYDVAGDREFDNDKESISVGGTSTSLEGPIILGWMQFNTKSIPKSTEIKNVGVKLDYDQDEETNQGLTINDVTGAYGIYTKDQIFKVWQDLKNGKYISIPLKEDPSIYWTLGESALQHFIDRLNSNKFQIGIIRNSKKYSEIRRSGSVLVVDYCGPLTIKKQPRDVSICAFEDASFKVTVNGNDQTNYQWYYSLLGYNWYPLSDGPYEPGASGSNTSTLTLSNFSSSWDGVIFRVEVFGNCDGDEKVVSNSASLEVGNVAEVLKHPKSTTVCIGDDVSFNTRVIFYRDIFQWEESDDGGSTWTDMVNSSDVSGADRETLTLKNVSASLSGRQYRLKVPTECETTYTDAAILTVNTPTTIKKQPRNVSVCAFAEDASFSVTVEGNDQKNYQWYYSLSLGYDWDPMPNGTGSPGASGANTSTLTLSNIPSSWDGVMFRVEVSGDCDGTKKVVSKSVRLDVGYVAEVKKQPNSKTVCIGDDVTFKTRVIFYRDIFQWEESDDGGSTWTDMVNSSDVSGADRETLTLKNVSASLSGRQYRLKVPTECETTYTDAATLTVIPPPTADAHPSGQSIKSGGNASFSAAFNDAVDVQWVYTTDGGNTYNLLNDGGNKPLISGATTNTLSLKNVPRTWDGREFALSGSNTSCPIAYTKLATLEVINSAPIANCQDITVSAGHSCLATITAYQVDRRSYDPDIGDKVSLSLDKTFLGLGDHLVTLTASDGELSDQCTAKVTVKDVTAPVPDVANLPTITASCEAGIEPPFATDNCAVQIIGTTSDPLYFDKEGTYTITWVYDDGNGNTSSQDQTIIIKNEVAPVPDRQTLPSLRAQCGLTVSQTPTATDQCGGTIVATTSDPLTYHTQGTHLITWTFDNGNGNTSTQTQKVVIRDTKAPVPDRSNLPALGGSCSLLITNFPTATDNCAGSVTATTNSPLEYDQEGTYAITWNYEDGNGNTSSQTQWVIISSDAEPTAECKNISVALGNNNQVNIKAEDIDKGSFDECGTVTLLISSAGSFVFSNSLPPAPSMDLYCKDGKVHNLLLSVTNEKGNTAHCQATIFLEGSDSDNDGILDQCDNCPDTYNSDQKDGNNNGTGDACEESTDPGTDPGSWDNWGLKKQESDQAKLITELRAFPNPFQEEVNLSFVLNQEEKTTVEIFNIQGQRVHTLLSEIAPKGEHRILWDGKDQNGQLLPAGIYLVRLRAGKALINQKVMLQR